MLKQCFYIWLNSFMLIADVVLAIQSLLSDRPWLAVIWISLGSFVLSVLIIDIIELNKKMPTDKQ